MRLSGLAFRGVAGLGDRQIDLVHPETGAPADLVVVSGPPASGKTRLLEAVMAAKEHVAPLLAAPDVTGFVRAGFVAAKVVLCWRLTEDERLFAGLDHPTADVEAIFRVDGLRAAPDDVWVDALRRYAHDGVMGKVESFPVWRTIERGAPAQATTVLAQREARTLQGARKYSVVPRFLDEIEIESESESDPSRAEAFARRLAALSPTCRWAGGAPGPRRFAAPDGAVRTLDELADSERDAVLFAATATLIGLDRSVVLVDRPEKFLPAELVTQFVRGLFTLGEDVQIVVATDLPDAVAAAAPSVRIDLG